MSNRLGEIIGCLAVLGTVMVSFAQTTSIELPRDNPVSQIKAGTGDQVVSTHCAICHSTDYIVGQPHLDAQHWNAEVQKMIKTYGAPISDTDAKIIADYLAKNYGTQVESQKPSAPNRPMSQLKPNEGRPRQQQTAESFH